MLIWRLDRHKVFFKPFSQLALAMKLFIPPAIALVLFSHIASFEPPLGILHNATLKIWQELEIKTRFHAPRWQDVVWLTHEGL